VADMNEGGDSKERKVDTDTVESGSDRNSGKVDFIQYSYLS
jgi:hypothetical protein